MVRNGKWQCERKKEHLQLLMQHLTRIHLHSNVNYTEDPDAMPCTCCGNIQDDLWLQKTTRCLVPVVFSCMTGIHLLNSTSSPQHSHHNFVLKEDDSSGADCAEKAVEIKTLSLSHRNDKEERSVLDAYLEMTGSSSKEMQKKQADSWGQ